MRRRRTLPLLAATLLTFGSLAGCLGAEPGDLAELDDVEAEAFVSSQTAWPMTGGTAMIPVCWEAAGAPVEKGWVRMVVEDRYERQPSFHVDFVGWGRCTRSSSGIRIAVVDEARAPHVRGHGQRIAGVAGGMVLNFTFENWGGGACNVKSGAARHRDCIQRMAVHEFGHAVGLAHEQNRPDRPVACDDAPQGTNGDVLVGNFDYESMMSYCPDDFAHWINGGHLSEGDVAGLTRLYGGGGDVFVGASTGSGFESGLPTHDGFCHAGELCLTGELDGAHGTDVIALAPGGRTLRVALAGPGGGLRSAAWTWRRAAPFVTALLGDFDGDGRDDLATISATGAIDIARSNGRDGFVASTAGAGWRDDSWLSDAVVRAGDLDGDGRDDLVIFRRGRAGIVDVVRSTGGRLTGNRRPWARGVAIGSALPLLGDVDGDGDDDVVVFQRGATGDVVVARSTGTALVTAGRWHDYFAPGVEQPAVADLDADGRADIVTFAAGKTGHVYAALSTGTGFAGQGWRWATGLCLEDDVCAVADVDGDRRADVIAFKRR